MEVRLARETDLPALAIIESAAAALFPTADLPEEVSQPAYEAELREGLELSTLWVIEDGSYGVIGFLLGREVEDCLHILEMDVLPEQGCKGAGSMLLDHAEAHAKNRDLQWLTLTTFAHLPWNAPMYARRGFYILADLERFLHLRDALAAETARGLKNRVAMVKDVA
jgi:ribosomal protein S18 acetylase RimI-like enzyme